ncbi:MAG TPA: FAD-dependent oxidoreductase [Bordetella sp.]|nr:FAD-dependent oxidoreductase [Bordetella sp.]
MRDLAGTYTATRVAVIGAGIVGAAIAYTLRQRGAHVTLIDRDEPGSGCSFGNSGAISPGSVAPLAMPGILKTVPGMLLDPESPLRLPLPYLPHALPWLTRFVAASRVVAVADAARRLAALHAGAVERHLALAREIGVPELILQRGHLHVYPDEAALAKDAGGWRLREQYGYHFEKLDRQGIQDLEPAIGPRYRIGVFLADHATVLNPFRYVQAIIRAYQARGGNLLRGQAGTPERAGSGWSLNINGARHDFQHVVVAAGAWTPRLLRPLGVRLNLESQRGYHVQFQGASATISRTVVLADRKVFVTPMEEGLRVGGTVEIAGLSRAPDPRRAQVLERIARETFTGIGQAPVTQWMGHRPCMPDSVPVIGAVPDQPGLWLAAGHGHLGLTDSVNTAVRIADAMLGETRSSASA